MKISITSQLSLSNLSHTLNHCVWKSTGSSPSHTHTPLLHVLYLAPCPHLSPSPQGLNPPADSEQTEAAALALSWKRKLYHQRTMEAITAPLGARGLRKLNRNRISTPSLVTVIQPTSTFSASYEQQWCKHDRNSPVYITIILNSIFNPYVVVKKPHASFADI